MKASLQASSGYDDGAPAGCHARRGGEPDRPRLGALIARMARGDQRALTELFDRTLAKVHGVALRITGRRDLAEEICIESYWQVWREAARYDAERGDPLAWLLMIVRSRAIDALRRSGPFVTAPEAIEHLYAQVDDPCTPVDGLLAAERAGALGRALECLSPVQRRMIGLAFYRDLSHREISEQTGLPLGTVKSHLKRAQDALRAALGSKGDRP